MKIIQSLMVSCSCIISLGFPAYADSEQLAKLNQYNYQLFCQGCHVADGRGGKDVPDMRQHVGIFLNTQEGREYLIRVPGSANSALNNKDLAHLMNWMVVEFGQQSVPSDFKPYTAQEVGRLRVDPLLEVSDYRTSLLEKITGSNQGE